MTAGELIQALQKVDPKALVFLWTHEWGYEQVDIVNPMKMYQDKYGDYVSSTDLLDSNRYTFNISAVLLDSAKGPNEST